MESLAFDAQICALSGAAALVLHLGSVHLLDSVEISIRGGRLTAPSDQALSWFRVVRGIVAALFSIICWILFVFCVVGAMTSQTPASVSAAEEESEQRAESSVRSGPSFFVVDRDTGVSVEAQIYLTKDAKRVLLGTTTGSGKYQLVDDLRCSAGVDLNIVPIGYSGAAVRCPIENDRRIYVRSIDRIENLDHNAKRLEAVGSYALAAFVYHEFAASDPAYAESMLPTVVGFIMLIKGNPLMFEGEPLDESGRLTTEFSDAIRAYQERQDDIEDANGQVNYETLSALAEGAKIGRFLYTRLP